jgi:dienelactone hydrolase
MFIDDREIAMAIIVVLICIIGIILLPYWIIPANPFPKPSGKWNVGTSNLIWDSSNQSGIIAKVWYPTDIENITPSPYLDKLGKNFSSNIVVNLLLKLIFSNLFLGHVKTPVSIDATPLQSPSGFPVILFSPGYFGINWLNSFYGLEFASNGFIVIGVNYPGSSAITLLADGSQIGFDSDGFDKPELLASKITVDRSSDLSMVLDRVISLNADRDSFLYQRINTSKIFAAGHSLGGSVSFAACGQDRRILKSVNFDGFFFMEEIDLSSTDKEFLLIQPDRRNARSKDKKSQNEFDLMMAKDSLRITELSGSSNFHHLLFPAVTHVSFMDLPLVINPTFSKTISLFGKADGLDLLLKTASVTMDFFNKQT